jgi:hypothetical protein
MNCICGHDLGAHPPDPQRPFAWPCRACACSRYREQVPESPIYILDAADGVPTMLFVRLHRRSNGTYRVFEGLTNR